MNQMFEYNGKFYTIEQVKDYWRKNSFVCYNDRDFYNWLKIQTIFKKVEI